jgi:hypothetical protein
MAGTEVQNQSRYYLYSFAPSTGIGFYKDGNDMFQFDLVTEEDVVLAGIETGSRHFEFDQVEAGLSFEELDKLKDFARNEYLRDKKNTYYACLFSTPLSRELRHRTLEILDDAELSKITLSPKAITAIKEIANPKLVLWTLKEASTRRLKNVEACLQYGELREIAFSFRRTKRSWNFIDRIRKYLDELISFPRRLFEFIFVPFLKAKVPAFEISQPEFYPAKFSDLTFSQLVSFLSEASFPANKELLELGNTISAAVDKWELVPSRPGRRRLFFKPWPWGEWEHPGELYKTTLSTIRRWSNQSAYNRSGYNILFSLNFVPWENLKAEPGGGDLEQCAFFISLYSNPASMFEKLRLEPYEPFEFYYDVWLREFEYLYEATWRSREPLASLQELYCTVNILSLMTLVTPKEAPLYWPELKPNLIRLVRRRPYPTFFKSTEFPDPWIILLNNFMSWAIQTRQEDLYWELVTVLNEVDFDKRELSLVVRFIL